MSILDKFKMRLIRRLDDCRGKGYDLFHNVDTFCFVSRAAVAIESDNGKFGLAYQRTPIHTIKDLFEHLTWKEDTTFIDFGCGKGLVLLAAAEHSFKRIIGVEYSSDLAKIARKNVSQFRGALRSRETIEIVHGDAAQFEFPNAPTICYFYNPFHPAIMEKVFDNLALSLRQSPREIQLVFHVRYPKDLVEDRFEILDCRAIPYFHIYRLASARERKAGRLTEDVPWELIETD